MGSICYWVDIIDKKALTLVFLPGLTADHRLFDKQIAYFKGKYNLLVWDAPGHAASWPFDLQFSLADKADWLYQIIEKEELTSPILIGQSMGGYVGQAYAQQYPAAAKGMIIIDSAPLQLKYTTRIELWLLKRMEPVYYYYPWKLLLHTGTKGVATSKYGQELMRNMMITYQNDKKRYAALSGHGMKILAEAIEKDLPYHIPCSTLLICGKQDRAGSCIRHNKAWHKTTGIPIEWIDQAGHNSNTDQPEKVNRLIEKFIETL